MWSKTSPSTVEIVEPTDQYPRMYHISDSDQIRKFTPMISSRIRDGEDNTVPRVCVSRNVFECILGYNTLQEVYTVEPQAIEGFKNGFYIYKFDYQYALKLKSNKLVPDARDTNEHWLVTYSTDTSEYQAKIVGKIFLNSVETTICNKLPNATQWLLYLEVEEPLEFLDKTLEPGTYSIIMPATVNLENYRDTKDVSVSTLDEAAYKAAKQQSAAMLSETPALPKWSRW